MIRRIRITWPDPRPFTGRDGAPIRLLAASDDPDPALEHDVNRVALAPIDGIVGCGDLDAAWLDFLAGAFRAPLVYVRGNHDRGGSWDESEASLPPPLAAGRTTHLAGITIGGLEWPGVDERGNGRHAYVAWRHALGLARRVLVARLRGRAEPILVISHVPPTGAGADATDAYHRGFSAYRWLLERLRPPLWLHGHTTTASVKALQIEVAGTILVNVTGAVLVELLPPTAGGQG